MACSGSSFEQAVLVLSRLAGLDINIMTGFRATDSVGSEFVKDVTAEIDADGIKEMTKKVSGNVLGARVDSLDDSDDKEEVIQQAAERGPDGVFHKDYSGPTIDVMYIQCDGTGVPGRRQELSGVKGKQPDGSAKTFEAKIGATFIVKYTADGKPLLTEGGEIYRDKKVSYVGTVRKVDDFGPMLYRHALDNGLEDMDAVVFLGDGAKWVWGIQESYFPYAMAGIDLYHAIEHVGSMVDLLNGLYGPGAKQRFKEKCIGLLRCGKVQEMLDLVETLPSSYGNEKKLDSAKGYFRTNIDHMKYGAFMACGIFVGSGVIEAGCKVIVGNRMKNAGMRWSKDSAEKMISLRCAIRNGEFFGSYLSDSVPHEHNAA